MQQHLPALLLQQQQLLQQGAAAGLNVASGEGSGTPGVRCSSGSARSQASGADGAEQDEGPAEGVQQDVNSPRKALSIGTKTGRRLRESLQLHMLFMWCCAGVQLQLMTCCSPLKDQQLVTQQQRQQPQRCEVRGAGGGPA